MNQLIGLAVTRRGKRNEIGAPLSPQDQSQQVGRGYRRAGSRGRSPHRLFQAVLMVAVRKDRVADGTARRPKIRLDMCASQAHITPVPVETKERREERLVARVSGADKQLFQRAASLEGRSVATFVIAHAREVARRIVADYETIELDAVQSRRFVKALLNPTPATPSRLKRAGAAYRQRVAA